MALPLGGKDKASLANAFIKHDENTLLLLQTNYDCASIYTHFVREGNTQQMMVYDSKADQNLVHGICEAQAFLQEW